MSRDGQMLVYSTWFLKSSPLAGMWQHQRDLPVWHLTFHLHKSVNVSLQKPIRTTSTKTTFLWKHSESPPPLVTEASGKRMCFPLLQGEQFKTDLSAVKGERKEKIESMSAGNGFDFYFCFLFLLHSSSPSSPSPLPTRQRNLEFFCLG